MGQTLDYMKQITEHTGQVSKCPDSSQFYYQCLNQVHLIASSRTYSKNATGAIQFLPCFSFYLLPRSEKLYKFASYTT